MSTAGLKGVNAFGHLGWVTKKCRICAAKIDITRDLYYVCPHCKDRYDAYFCPADAKRLHYRCPFCGRELKPVNIALYQPR